jgi:AraC-like DNA-binding protein
MISLAAAAGLTGAIRAAGGDPARIARTVALDPALFTRLDGSIPCSDFARLLDEAARATGDDCFGLHFGERYQPKQIGALAYVVLNSPSIRSGFENAVRYLRVHNEAAVTSLDVEPARAYLRFALRGVPVEIARQQSEYALVVTLNTIRLMAGSRWAPLEVQFAHPAPRDAAEHLRVFGCPVSFGGRTNALAVEPQFLDRQVPAADEGLYPILRKYLDRVLKEMPHDDRALADVRRAIGESMREGEPKLAAVARRTGASPRTLQRRLGELGVDFKSLVDDTRRRFSLKYLEDRANTPTEIAYLLGYSEVSAFNRAFKRWTGSSPVKYRRPKRRA